MASENEISEKEIDELAKKIIHLIGFAIIGIAILLVSINICCRFAGAKKGKKYEYTDGVVTKVDETKTYQRGSKQAYYDYTIWVDYIPVNDDKTYTFLDSSHAYENIGQGDVLRVYYQEDDPEEAYVARKDWLTKMYLPAEKHYNIPLFISVALIFIGILFFIDDEKLKSKIGKKK